MKKVDSMNFKDELKARTERVEKILKKFLPAEEGYQTGIFYGSDRDDT